jgi:hypothetical protein
MIKISLLITTFNDPLRLKQTLDHYLKQNPQPFEILVCDDGSTFETKELVGAFAKIARTPIIHLYQEDKGWDAPGIRNLGAIMSRGNYLLMTDGDCVPHPRFIHDHLAAAEDNCFVVGERSHILKEHALAFSTRADVLLYYVCTKKVHKRSFTLRNPFEKPAVYTKECFLKIEPLASKVMACNFGVWKSDFIAVNGFDESFRSWWPEDAECSARLLNSGLKLKKYRKKCLVYHLNHDETSRQCAEEYRFAERSLISGARFTTNGIEQRLSRMSKNQG